MEVLPLYARLSAAEQHRVFEPHTARRVVLATNVAETSLTVPGVRYVVDPGTARVSRYSHRLKVQRLPIERVSQASANQRAGRCGRTSDGICIRLYSEDDFLERPEFTEPEILRTNLASVILQMTALGLGDLAAFPFLDPPDRRQVKDGLDLLVELGALERRRPAPRRAGSPGSAGRWRACRSTRGWPGCCSRPTATAASPTCWSSSPPCRSRTRASGRPSTSRRPTRCTAASPTTGRTSWPTATCGSTCRSSRSPCPATPSAGCAAPSSCTTCGCGSGRTWCGQLRQVAKSIGLSTAGELGAPGDEPKPVHLSLLPGLLSHVGLWDPDRREYAGARGAHFATVARVGAVQEAAARG